MMKIDLNTTLARAAALVVVALMLVGVAADAQKPKPLPKPDRPQEPKFEPLKDAPKDSNVQRAPAPTLRLTTDYDCRVELDGEEVAVLTKDESQAIRVRPGEHLLQAFPIGIEGPPPWKSTVSVKETGQVVELIELAEVVQQWQDEQERLNVEGRFVEVADGAVIRDRTEGYLWLADLRLNVKWAEAERYCSNGSFGGVGGWRLPTLRELSTIYWPDHPEPQFGAANPEITRRLFGLVKQEGEMEVLPVLVYEPWEHNRLSSVWTVDKGTVCSFLGELGCRAEKRGDVLCLRRDR